MTKMFKSKEAPPRMSAATFSAVLGLLASAVLADSSGSNRDPVADAMPYIQRANSEWSRAMKTGDADAIAEPYAIDAVFVTAGGESVRGRTAIRDLYRMRLRGKAPVVSAAIERRGTNAGDRDLVFEWGIGTVTTSSVIAANELSTLGAAGASLDKRSGLYFTLWKRQEGGRWEIIRNVVL
jgi:uncharacterized protein (TIGR02246 family)